MGMRFLKNLLMQLEVIIRNCEKSVFKASDQYYEVKIKILLTSISQQNTQAKLWCFQTAE